MGVVLIGGGARSGKSRFALHYAEARFERRAYLATAEALDEEMQERIRRHQLARSPAWRTIEEPLELVNRLTGAAPTLDCIVVDCLTLWLSNVLLHPDRDAHQEIERLVEHLNQKQEPTTVLITNEVGCGIVPDNELGRRFRDLAGEMNHQIAEIADEVYWVVFGMPLEMKSLSRSSLPFPAMEASDRS